MKNVMLAITALTILAGCDTSAEKVVSKSGEAHNCTTTGQNSPIVTGQNSVVVIDGKTYAPGQGSDCAPANTNLSTSGAGSPIVTGAGSKVSVHIEQ